MRLLHFVHTYIPVFGGTTTRLMGLFARDGNAHVMIAPAAGGHYVPASITQLAAQDVYDNVKVRRVSLTAFPKWRLHLLDSLDKVRACAVNARELMAAAPSSGVDLVYGHNPLEFAAAARAYCRACGVPLVYEVHGLVKDTLPGGTSFLRWINAAMGNFLILRIERRVLSLAAHVIVQTNRMRDRGVAEFARGVGDVTVVPNGVDVEVFRCETHREAAARLRAERALGDKVVLAYFGFLDNNNGIKFLLDSVASMPAELKSRVHVLILGRGPYAGLVRSAAAGDPGIEYLGLVDHDHIPPYYGMADVFVIPRPSNAATENLLPMKLLEAMAMEKTVIVSDVGGMTAVVRDGENGVVFRREDTEDFVRRLRAIVDGPENRARLGAAARRSVLDAYSWEVARERLRDVYARVLAGSP